MNSAPPRSRYELGYLSLGALFGLVFLGVLTLLTWEQIKRSEATISLIVSTDRAYERALITLGERLRSPSPSHTPSIVSVYAEGRFGDTTVGITAQLLGNDHDRAPSTPLPNPPLSRSASPPLIDLDSLLDSPTVCSERLATVVGRSTFGKDLTPGSLTSAHTCEITPVALAPGSSFHDNLGVTERLVLRSPTSEGLYTLTTAGFLDAVAPIEIRGSILLIAGGDLFVAALEAPVPSTVTLVSVTGRIIVGQVASTLSVHALGYGGVELPPNTSQTLTAPPLPRRERLLLGVRRGSPQ